MCRTVDDVGGQSIDSVKFAPRCSVTFLQPGYPQVSQLLPEAPWWLRHVIFDIQLLWALDMELNHCLLDTSRLVKPVRSDSRPLQFTNAERNSSRTPGLK